MGEFIPSNKLPEESKIPKKALENWREYAGESNQNLAGQQLGDLVNTGMDPELAGQYVYQGDAKKIIVAHKIGSRLSSGH